MSAAAESSLDGATRGWATVSSRLRRARHHWPWIPIALAVVYAGLLAATLRSVVAAIYVNADVAAAPNMGEFIGAAPSGTVVVLGNIPWYTALWFEELTHWLPLHRQLWELTPWLLGLIGIGLTAWATTRLAGRWAGWIVAVTCACGGATLLPEQFAWSVHAVSYVHICVLGAVLVPLALAPGWIGGRPWRHGALLVLLAVLTGLGVASDELVIVGGLVPFVVAGAVLAYLSPRLERRRVLGSVVGVTAAAVGVAGVVTHFALADHIIPRPFPITFSAFNQLLYHVGDLLGSLAVIANGNFGGGNFSLTSAVAFASAASVMLAVYAVLRSGRTIIIELGERGYGEGLGQPRTDAARLAFLTFWVICALAVSAAFVASSIPVGLGTNRYLVPVAYALIVITVIAACERPAAWGRVLLVAGSSVIIAGSILTLAQRQIQTSAQPGRAVADRLLSFARANGVSVGYSGYWDASPLTWELRTKLQVFPVISCGPVLCQFPFHKMSSWFTPRPGSHTFLVIDSNLATVNSLGSLPAGLGKPVATGSIPPLTVYVYPYDIATKIAPP